MKTPTRVTILGATGSIGRATLDVIARHPDRYRVFALAAQRNWQALLELVAQHRPAFAALSDPAAACALAEAVVRENLPTTVLAGDAALEELAAHPDTDTVMAAIVGAAGLASSLAAARAGKRILLANKEALVVSGPLFMRAVTQGGATLLPIDSEHNAVFQCLPSGAACADTSKGVAEILLTASGGPFLKRDPSTFATITPEEAVAHPNWRMGRKISVDSATMMNKGLEVIEAHWLFDAPPAAIGVVIHPQSVVHSMVRYVDGSVLAQLGNPDMRTPIAYGLAWPERIDAGVAQLSLAEIGRLDFAPLDERRFPCVSLARAALLAGGTAPAVLNAANEVAVAAFLERELPFTDIAGVIDATLTRVAGTAMSTLEDALQADAHARAIARETLVTLRRRTLSHAG